MLDGLLDERKSIKKLSKTWKNGINIDNMQRLSCKDNVPILTECF